MTIKTTLKLRRTEILQLAQKYGVSNIRIFGSVKNELDSAQSDIDFLVDLEKGRSLLDLGGLAYDLEKLFNKRVDIVTEKGLHWYIKDKIISQAEPL